VGYVPAVANEKVYIHELIEITGQNRAKYMHHMTANWGPIGREQRNMLCVGVWGTVGSTERWPETVNLWEIDGWTGLAANFRHEFSHPTLQDPALAEWWAEAATFRRGGHDRVLVPAPYSPTLAEAMAQGIRGDVYYHELVSIAPGRAREYLALVEFEWLPIADRIGLRLLGAFRTAMVNDSEAVMIWAIDSWETWARVQVALDGDTEVARWRDRTRALAPDWRGKLIVDSPLNPLKTGTIL
jgi:hypothetical protein